MLEVGDFAENKLHHYISFIYGIYEDSNFYGGIILTESDNILVMTEDRPVSQVPADIIGTFRMELEGELKKVPTTLKLVKMAQEQLSNEIISSNRKRLDNLSYIELLDKLSTQEKILNNETKR